MELSNYELVRYPSGQLVITRTSQSGSGFRDIVGVYASEPEARSVLERLLQGTGDERPAAEYAALESVRAA